MTQARLFFVGLLEVFICIALTRCDDRCFSLTLKALGLVANLLSFRQFVPYAQHLINQSASVEDEPPSRDGFSVDLFVAGDIGALLLAAGVFVPSIMVSTAVPAGSLFELQSDGINAAPTSRRSSIPSQSSSAHMAHQFPPQPPGQFYNYHGGGTTHMQAPTTSTTSSTSGPCTPRPRRRNAVHSASIFAAAP